VALPGITYEVAKSQRLALVALRNKRPFERDWQHTPAILEHEDPAAAWKRATRTGEAGIIPRMSGLVAFESDNLQRRNELLRFLQVGGVVPCYVEMRRGDAGKLHVFAWEPRILEPDEDCAFYFDEGGLTAKRTAQLRCCLGPASDYQPVLVQWDAPRLTEAGYRRMVALADRIEQTQARRLRESTGTAHDAGSRHTAVYRLGCLLFRFTGDPDAVESAAWQWQEAKFGDDALTNRREVARQLRGSLLTVRGRGEVAVERERRNDSRFAVEDARRHLEACLNITWTDDADLIAAMALEVVPDGE
jgi:hypothetical protein